MSSDHSELREHRKHRSLRAWKGIRSFRNAPPGHSEDEAATVRGASQFCHRIASASRNSIHFEVLLMIAAGTYSLRAANSIKDGIETETVTEVSGGCVPVRIPFASISIACPASGGIWIVAASSPLRTHV